MKLQTFLFCFLIILIIGCKDNFEVNADWKDITIVYGLLSCNSPDSIQYIKVNKAFLNEGTSALMVAQNLDSLTYKDSLLVTLDEFNHGSFMRQIKLFREFSKDKDSGLFSYPGQYLYRTPKTVINPEYTYNLTIKNIKTNKEIKSSSEIVDNMEAVFPKVDGLMTFYPHSQLDIRWYSGKNAYFYDLEIEINYKEYKISNPTVKVDKVLHWSIFTYMRTPDLDGGVELTSKIMGSSFYDFLAYNIPVDMTLERQFKSFRFIYSAGGQEIYYYIHVNQPSIGIIQKKPEYSNIENGYGVFSSRNQNIYSVRLSTQSLDSMKYYPATMNLNFVN
jgi:hypothetical protein